MQIKDGETWLSENSTADSDDIKAKQKDIEAICNPIVQKVYGQGGASAGSAGESEDYNDAHDEL